MPVDGAVARWQEAVARVSDTLPDLGTIDPARRRAAAHRLSDTLATEFTLPAPAGCAVTEHRMRTRAGAVDVLRYRAVGAGDVRPAQMYLHGGGFVLGSIREEVNDRVLRRRAVETGCDIFAVEYRLAPEHRFPAAVQDCLDVLVRLASQADELGIDPERIGVGGASAGGNLAAMVAIAARDGGGPPIRHQVLEVPVMSLLIEDDDSYREYGAAANLGDIAALRWLYLGTADEAVARRASPLATPDLSGLPPALIMTAECDPLRDSGAGYAARLVDSGVAAELICAPGQVHGSSGLTRTSAAARRWQTNVERSMRAALGGQPCR